MAIRCNFSEGCGQMPELTAANKQLEIAPVQGQKAKKKVAFIFNHSLFQGGGEISFFELVKGLDRNLFEPLVIVPGQGEIKTRTSERGMEVRVCPFPSLRSMGRGLPFGALVKLFRMLRQNRVDLIHVNGSRACFYGGIAGRLLAIPVIWHVRETIQDRKAYDRLLASFSAAIICVSRSVQIKRFAKFGPGVCKKLQVVYNGVDTQHFIKDATDRAKIRLQLEIGNRSLFGIVGNMIPLKGQAFFLNAVAEAKKMQPDVEIKAVFIGRYLDTDYKERLYRLTADLNLRDDVIFKGYCDNISAYLSACDVFVLPSQREGCSRALLEAMSSGLPVIASKISEIEEVVQTDRNAILVEYGNVFQMATAITKLAENKRLRELLGNENEKRAEAIFGLQAHVDCIQGVYKNLLMKSNKEKNYAHCP